MFAYPALVTMYVVLNYDTDSAKLTPHRTEDFALSNGRAYPNTQFFGF